VQLGSNFSWRRVIASELHADRGKQAIRVHLVEEVVLIIINIHVAIAEFAENVAGEGAIIAPLVPVAVSGAADAGAASIEPGSAVARSAARMRTLFIFVL
jgi:hypothetical protein